MRRTPEGSRPRLLHLLAPICLALTWLLAAPAQAGRITGIQLDPPQRVYVGETVRVTVLGQNSCNNGVSVYFGVGGSQQQKAGSFPLSGYEYHYGRPGTFQIKAYRSPNQTSGCDAATAATTIEVIRPGDKVSELCKVTKCEDLILKAKIDRQSTKVAKAAMTPEITGFLFNPIQGNQQLGDGTVVLTQGGELIVKGRGFGPSRGDQGKLMLVGDFGSADRITLHNLVWDVDGTRVKGKVPTNASQPIRTAANIRLINQWGNASNDIAVEFETVGEIKLLPSTSGVVSVLKCGDAGNSNSCNEVTSHGGCMGHAHNDGREEANAQLGFQNGYTREDFTIYGSHANCNSAVGDDEGQDKFEINLGTVGPLSQCVIYDVDYTKVKTAGSDFLGGPGENTIREKALGRKVWKPSISWRVSPADGVTYIYRVYVKCPKS